jgi:hypothetical protein
VEGFTKNSWKLGLVVGSYVHGNMVWWWAVMCTVIGSGGGLLCAR